MNPGLKMIGLGLLVAGMALLGSAQDPASNETIWASVIYTYHGDRTPLVWPVQNMLTSLGAQQLFSAGSFFRRRYLTKTQGDENGSAINKISTDALDNIEVFAMSTIDQYTAASGLAFIQGLYPPTNVSSDDNSTFVTSPSNGSEVTAPLDGYQYPRLLTFSPDDPSSITIEGQSNCPLYIEAMTEFANSDEAVQAKTESQAFYDGIESNILNDVFPGQNISFDYAYLVHDYLNYENTHDEKISRKLTEVDLAQARDLANHQIRGWNGYSSDGEPASRISIQTIAGQTLAAQIVGLLLNNLQSQGIGGKLNLLFGSFEPIVEFSVLTGLAMEKRELSEIPDFGSSMVFEMFSKTDSENEEYPSSSDLYIRFFFRNGTASSSQLVPYPLFGASDTLDLSFGDFLENMQNLSISSTADWCSMCQNDGLFCAAYSNLQAGGGGTIAVNRIKTKNGIKPVLAGVIGAIVTLAVASIILALFMLFGGVRFHRARAQRRSKLGGFKAGQKLASDRDVPDHDQKSGPGTIIPTKGDDRVNSWELRDHGDDKPNGIGTKPDHSRRQSFDTEVEPYHSIEPTRIDDRV